MEYCAGARKCVSGMYTKREEGFGIYRLYCNTFRLVSMRVLLEVLIAEENNTTISVLRMLKKSIMNWWSRNVRMHRQDWFR